MKRTPLRRGKPLRRSAPKKRARGISECSEAQREKVADRACIICAAQPCHPAHLIDKSLCGDGNGDPRAVVALCPPHHRAYDEGGLSILEFLEPHWREELAFAVERFGLLRTLERVTNDRWTVQSFAAVANL